MTKLRFTPKDQAWNYHCAEFSARAGDVVEVSDVKARQLLGDFPGQWAPVEPEPAAPVPAPAGVPPGAKPKR